MKSMPIDAGFAPKPWKLLVLHPKIGLCKFHADDPVHLFSGFIRQHLQTASFAMLHMSKHSPAAFKELRQKTEA